MYLIQNFIVNYSYQDVAFEGGIYPEDQLLRPYINLQHKQGLKFLAHCFLYSFEYIYIYIYIFNT